MNEPGKCVFVANGQIQAQQVRTFLQAQGVASVLRGESLTKTHGLTLNGLGRVEVLVAEADEERACALLASADAGEFRLEAPARWRKPRNTPGLNQTLRRAYTAALLFHPGNIDLGRFI